MKLITKILIFVIIIYITANIYKKIKYLQYKRYQDYLDNIDGETINTDIVIKDSSIHGVGLFAKKDFNKNDYLFKGIHPTKEITHYASLINHSYKPNSYLLENKNGWFVIALKHIKNGDEITADYRHTPYFIAKPDPSWK